MKKPILIVALLALSCSVWAQKNKMRDAADYVRDNNYKKAIPVSDEVVLNADTKNNPDAWYWRGMAYLLAAVDTSAKIPNAASESYTSLMKALALKPDYGQEINNPLYSNALLSFNEGVASYTKKDFSASYDKFMKVVTIYNVGGGKRFAADKNFAELVTSAKSNAAYSAYNAKRDNEALALFTELKNTTAKKDSNIYQVLIDIETRQNNDAQMLATITEARTLFPNSQLFRNIELNYYIKAGKQDVLLGKLEDAVKADPGNAELQFNLANAYQNAAFPKDAKGNDMPRAANFADIFAKGEAAYGKALAISPDNADYNYNYGVLYYDEAAYINKQMSAIKGLTPAEQKQYDALLKDRDAMFDRALPYFDKAYMTLDARSSNLNAGDKFTYQKSMIGLREIYSRKNNKAKTDELKAKLEALK